MTNDFEIGKSVVKDTSEAARHVAGTSVYVDDMPLVEGTVFALAFPSPIAHGRIRDLDLSVAVKSEGVVRILTYQDIPGQNQIGGIVPDEPLLAEEEVHFRGQPIALIIAATHEQAHLAREKIRVDIEPMEIVTDPREAYHKGLLLHPSRTFSIGESQDAFTRCHTIVQGSVEIGGQEHVYIEPQGAYAIPMENHCLRIHSSTQGPTHVQRTVARVLGIPMHHVEVDVNRIGGGFGGKEDQATTWATMVALAAFVLNLPVKCILDRKDDMMMTGKRHPYSGDYKLGLDQDLKILAYDATYFQNGGAAADLSPAVLERTLFHGTNSYYIPNTTLTAHCCKTHLPPNTAFRGFGGPQGMVVIESAIHHAAQVIGISARQIQEKNLLYDGCEFPYGQIITESTAQNCWSQALTRYNIHGIEDEVNRFNATNPFEKKGLAVMPVCFGISFTNTQMNQARALVHVYGDGSIGVSTGAVEMGQGVNEKMIQVAASAFGVNTSRVKIETTNTTRVANTSPSAASATSDLNGKALLLACEEIRLRLITLGSSVLKAEKNRIDIRDEQVFVDQEHGGMSWQELIQQAIAHRVSLSAKGHYATPLIHFDKKKEKGHPFAYHVYGTAIVVSRVDCLRGVYEIERVALVHDCGTSMNLGVDLGQIEGGLVQGIGWMTLEELKYDSKGVLLSNTLATYKIPGIFSTPKHLDVSLLETEGSDYAIQKSKAVGEPPLMYGIGAYFSLYNAILSFNPKAVLKYDTPMTPEKVLMMLYDVTGIN